MAGLAATRIKSYFWKPRSSCQLGKAAGQPVISPVLLYNIPAVEKVSLSTSLMWQTARFGCGSGHLKDMFFSGRSIHPTISGGFIAFRAYFIRAWNQFSNKDFFLTIPHSGGHWL